MTDMQTTLTFVDKIKEAAKAPHIDTDRFITLTPESAKVFCAEMNSVFASPKAAALLKDGRQIALALIITGEPTFPFNARVVNGNIVLAPALDKRPNTPVLKDVSDGVTTIYKHFVTEQQASETIKVPLAMLFQQAIQKTYLSAGMDEGAHTKYIWRGC